MTELVRQKEEEVSILQGTLNTTLERAAAEGGSEANHIREIVSLKRQVLIATNTHIIPHLLDTVKAENIRWFLFSLFSLVRREKRK